MSKKYNIFGAQFTDPTFEVVDFTRKVDEGITSITVVVADANDSVSFTVVDESEPANYKSANSIRQWITGVLDLKHPSK